MLRNYVTTFAVILFGATGLPAAEPAPGFRIQLDTIHRGYDGKTCWVHPRAGTIPGEQPSVVLTMQKLLLTGSDVFFALNEMRTDDLGKTWSEPKEHGETLGRREEPGGVIVATCDFTPKWHAKSGKLLGTGQTVRYLNDRVIDNRERETSYSVYDPAARTWSRWAPLTMPDAVKFQSAGAGSVQRLDLPDGDILLPIYFKSKEQKTYRTTVVRCSFDGTTLAYRQHGSELTVDGGRGLYEPSLTRFGGRYFLTLRNDAAGYVATSDDGLHFNEPKKWLWDDGTDLGNYNTQQHWVAHKNGLFLVYTRKGANNDHVFRHRAPLFIAQVDPATLRVIRQSEQVLVPERGARLGNFAVTDVNERETWVTVAEWMQTKGPNIVIPPDNKYGADNSVYVARIIWEEPNQGVEREVRSIPAGFLLAGLLQSTQLDLIEAEKNRETAMLHRRDAMIRLGQVALGGLSLPGLLAAKDAAAARRAADGFGAAKSCILVYLWGGPPQQDTFDLKPDAPDGVKSPFLPISTAVPGIQICDQLPQIAKQTDKLAIIRSFTHPSNQHEVGVYHTLTGKINNTLVVPRNQRNRRDFPMIGSTVSYFSPPGDLPAAATIPRPIGHDGVVYTGTYAGFLGPQHDPLELQAPAEVQEKAPHGLELPAGWDAHRLQSRVGLLKTVEAYDRLNQQHGHTLTGLSQFREQAFRMLTSSAARDAFDLAKETDQLRDRYGRNEYGESFLLARRLVEAGVRLVTIVWYYVCKDGNVANVWDNHGGTGSLGGITGYQMLKENYCLPPLDQGYSALIEDLADRQRLGDTLVAMLGEFGRTPKINATSGRDHWGPCQSVVFAGGGIRGGQVYGASDKTAAYPTDKPVKPEDLIATVYHSLGIAPDAMLYDQQRRPHRACEGEPVLELF